MVLYPLQMAQFLITVINIDIITAFMSLNSHCNIECNEHLLHTPML